MKRLNQGMLVVIAVLAIMGAGCIVHKNGHGGGGGGGNAGWQTLTQDTNLIVGEQCPVTCLPDLCSGFLDTDVYYDSIYLSDYDYGLNDIHLNYAIENQGYDYTDVSITLCDDYGCEEVAYLPALAPGEYYEDSIDGEVLDSAMIDFRDCLDTYGDYCSLYYNIDVYIDEGLPAEGGTTCSATTFNYFFEGYYLW